MSWRVRRDISTARNIPGGMMDNKFATLQPYAISSQNTCPRQALCRGDIINPTHPSLSSSPSIPLIIPVHHPYPHYPSPSSAPSITLILPIHHSHPSHPSPLSALSIILIRPTSIPLYAVNTAAIQSPPPPSSPSLTSIHNRTFFIP